MRILQVLPYGDNGGAQRITVNLAKALEDRGHEVALASATGEGVRQFKGKFYELPRAGRDLGTLAACSYKLRLIIREWKPHIVHGHSARLSLPIALTTLHQNRRRGLVTVHGLPPEQVEGTCRVLRWCFLPVASDGPGMAAEMAQRGVPCVTIVNGVSPAPVPMDRKVLDRIFGIPSDLKLVVSIGRLVSQKNQALAIRAMMEVPEAALLIIGDGPLRSELEEMADRSGLVDRVRFAGFQPEPRSILGAADVFALPSVWEGLPLVGLEALAGGVPVVATEVIGIREWLNNTTAVLVRPNDAHSLAQGIRRVLRDQTLAQELIRNGRHLVLEYSEESVVLKYEELYQNLLIGKVSREARIKTKSRSRYSRS